MMGAQKKSIVIVGNSGFARECHIMLRAMMECDPSLEFRGFLSFEGYQADLRELSPFYLGPDDSYTFASEDYAVIGIGDPHLRKKAYAKLKARGAVFFNLIHPSTYIDGSSLLGEANIFGCRCHVTCHCAIGNGNVFNGLIHIGHDVSLGDYNFIAPGTQILGNVSAGSCNAIGATSVLLPHCRLGNNNIVAPLSAVYKGCKNNCYMAGNPAVKVGTADHPRT